MFFKICRLVKQSGEGAKTKRQGETGTRYDKALLQSTEFPAQHEFSWKTHAVAIHAVTSMRWQKSKENKSLKKKKIACALLELPLSETFGE